MCRRQRPPDRAAHRLDQPCQVHAVTSTRHRDTRNGARSIRRAGRRQAGGEGGVHRRCERRAGVRCGRRRRRRRRRDVQDHAARACGAQVRHQVDKVGEHHGTIRNKRIVRFAGTVRSREVHQQLGVKVVAKAHGDELGAWAALQLRGCAVTLREVALHGRQLAFWRAARRVAVGEQQHHAMADAVIAVTVRRRGMHILDRLEAVHEAAPQVGAQLWLQRLDRSLGGCQPGRVHVRAC
mmetsp:Transcript_38478/g.114202  ORF Transcript_38478/g.114202 Transcript_38478/m.114202 type:complete len:238 (-) Transcript_38478:680-1393(-)